MRNRPSFVSLILALLTAPGCLAGAGGPDERGSITKTRSALGGIEGSFEAAMDAPWRIEPAFAKDGNATFGAIPIQVSIHDANQAASDSGRWAYDYSSHVLTYVPTTPRLGNFCELIVEQNDEGTVYRDHKSFKSLTEVEVTTGSWKPGTMAPPHQVCKPATEVCDTLQDIGPSSEWHAGAWFYPRGKLTPGRDIPLTLTTRLTRDPATACEGGADTDYLTITNYVRVHLGEAPLPRFDNGWLYGDIHAHAQGTDNEGEAAYHFRGVMRAIGAMGIDFALASDHASNSEQIVDVDVDVYPFYVDIENTRGVLRDMNPTRFAVLHDELWKPDGVNANALAGPDGTTPQGYQSHNVVPRMFIGGEVDVIPEVETGWDGKSYEFGNGLRMELDRLCEGWFSSFLTIDGDCEKSTLRYDGVDAVLFKDVQGIHDYGFARAHLVYLPRNSNSSTAFIPSFTGKYGGGGRRLTETFEGREGVLSELPRKGYAFLAHPVPIGACPQQDFGGLQANGASLMTDLNGGMGPDLAPYTDLMLSEAFQSPAVLGLEFWNEDTRLCTAMGNGDAHEFGFDAPGDFSAKKLERYGFQTGQFGLAPYYHSDTGEFESYSTGVEWMLHHGARQWDNMLHQGIDPIVTGSLSWLRPGEPRRVFMGGGSDAHGDFNYRREGYMTGATKITDTALAKVRNLVYAGAPDSSKGTDLPQAHSQAQIVSAISQGNFSVTDGPALRILVDRNRNGVIDAQDIPMGGIVELNGETTLPMLVQWISTAEFGPLTDLQLYVGVQSGAGIDGRAGRTYAVASHGPQSPGIGSSDVVSSTWSGAGLYQDMKDGYTIDPTGLLKVPVGASGMAGLAKVDLPIAAFETAKGITPDRMYVRAFAQTAPKDASACETSVVEPRKGACIRRYAFTNPIWAMPGPKDSKGNCSTNRPRALDRDGDGIPDGCVACPDTIASVCVRQGIGLKGDLLR